MRTNIVIDDDLMRQAIQLTGLATKRAVVEAALRMLVQVKRQAGIRRLRGQVEWCGDGEAARRALAR